MLWDAFPALLSPKWVIPDENSFCFKKTIYLFYPFLVCRAVWPWHTAIAAGGQRFLDALRCIHSLIWAPNEWFQWKSFFELRTKITFFTHFLVYRAVCPWHTYIAAGGLGAAQGPQKPEGSRCSEMHTQPILSTLTFLYIKICTTLYDLR